MSDAPESESVAVEEIAEVEALLEEEPAEAAPSVNPFALDDDHEFKAPAQDIPTTGLLATSVANEMGTTAESYAGINRSPESSPATPPAMPGTPESIYRHCPCIGVMPGRACPRCAGTKWVKTCPKCEGEMFRTLQTRRGAHPRTERCGFCMGLGQVAARLSEVREAEAAARAYIPSPVAGKPVYPRGPQLPGVRLGTFAERVEKKSAGLPKNRRNGRGRRRAS